ncbi:hypothetical protein RIF29_28641 [Crotalaria pallida]|uniref:Uncharacterized protein n=1 Tax=Crotalaria pallida TaxID=3830 RepID=A0AAN9HWQ0_CROPI
MCSDPFCEDSRKDIAATRSLRENYTDLPLLIRQRRIGIIARDQRCRRLTEQMRKELRNLSGDYSFLSHSLFPLSCLTLLSRLTCLILHRLIPLMPHPSPIFLSHSTYSKSMADWHEQDPNHTNRWRTVDADLDQHGGRWTMEVRGTLAS